jgi:hypothetical protein
VRDVTVPIPDLADFDRVALSWRDDLGVELHVMEDGAGWMSEGHVHPSAPRDITAAANGLGFMTTLGDPDLSNPMLAQVYTMPRAGGPSTATCRSTPPSRSPIAPAPPKRAFSICGATRRRRWCR